MALLTQLSDIKSRFSRLTYDGASRRPQWLARPKSRSVVVPANLNSTARNHPEWLSLTNLDRVVNPTFVSILFFYEGVPVDSFNAVTASLKESLAKVLVDFYPLAGRLALKDETGIVDLHCNDAGAIFIEASANVELAELGGPQPMPILSGMDMMGAAAGLGPGLLYTPDQITQAIPVLVVQVTQFKCGSVALAANWHHTVADGYSGCHFMKSWAQVSTGQALTLQPFHGRHLLRPRIPLDPSMHVMSNNHYVFDQKSDLKLPVPIRAPNQNLRTFLAKDDHLAAKKAPIVKPFLLSNDSVRRLKENANNDVHVRSSIDRGLSDGHRQFTSVEVVSGELWKLMTRARSIDDDEFCPEKRSRFFIFVDGRKVLGLPPGYFGNVVCAACAESTQGDLLSKPLSYAASLIQTAKRTANIDYFRSLIDWVEEQGITSSTVCKSGHVNSTGYDVAATFWSFFPLYEIDFGWGTPVLTVRNAPPRKLIDGISMMPSPRSDTSGTGNMLALLNLQADRMHSLEQDPQFRDTAQFFNMRSSSPISWGSNKFDFPLN